MMNRNRAQEIVKFARSVRRSWGWNPMVIAEKAGIKIYESTTGRKPSAYIIKTGENYPAMIALTDCTRDRERYVLCAHELGHYFLHSECGLNKFEGKKVDTEYEANLFAVAFLCDDWQLNQPVAKLPGSVLKSILDYNLK